MLDLDAAFSLQSIAFHPECDFSALTSFYNGLRSPMISGIASADKAFFRAGVGAAKAKQCSASSLYMQGVIRIALYDAVLTYDFDLEESNLTRFCKNLFR